MTGRTRRTFEWAPLEAEVVRRLGGPGARCLGSLSPDGWTVADIAAYLGVTVAAVKSRRRGVMAWPAADRYAVAAGLHPSSVWPEWFEEAS